MIVVQLNLNHCAAAHDLLSQSIRERGVDVAAISEPYRVGPGPYWAVDSSGKAALWSCGITPKRMADVRSERGFVSAKMAGWWMFSVYLAPSMSFEDFGDAVDRLAADARCHTPCLIAGDFNAWAVDWGSSLTNARGRTLLEPFSTLDVTLLNTGAQPTFSRAGASSVVDLTFVSCSRDSQCTWVLSDVYTGSDHAAIITALDIERAQPTPLLPQDRRGYKADTLDIQSFAEHMQRLEANGSAEQMAESAMIQLQTACDDCMSAKRAHRDSVIIVKKIHGAKQGAPHDAESIDRIVEHLFPRTDNPRDTPETATHSLEGFEPVLDTEILAVAMRIREAKAPGPDLVPKRALRLALSLRPDLFAELYARPICLIDGAGKVLEQLIRTRLEKAIATAGDLSDSQFGFRKAKSTVDAISKVVGIAKAAIAGQRWKGGAKEYCLIVTLDVRNAFNRARWDCILDALSSFGVPPYLLELLKSYFRGRTLVYDSDGGARSAKLSCGVPQGSVLAPLLWNAMYDGVLRLPLPGRTELVGFADDIAVVVVDKELAGAEELCDRSISRINLWLSSVGLQLAPQKTEAMLVSSRKKVEVATIRVCGASIRSSRAIKYMGVMIDTRLSFREHLAYASTKATTAVRAVGRLMLNHRGPKQASRLLLSSVARASMFYASPVWGHVLATPVYSRGLSASKGRWTYRMIPQLECWLKRKPGQINFHLTQILSGHGSFRSYLRRFGQEEDDSCTHCQGQLEETAEHTVFNCARFAGERASLEARLGNTITAENLVPLMLLSQANWHVVSDFAAKAMTEL
nr:uncharacterized protein LOC121503173 [Drosophila kikkawai]